MGQRGQTKNLVSSKTKREQAASMAQSSLWFTRNNVKKERFGTYKQEATRNK